MRVPTLPSVLGAMLFASAAVSAASPHPPQGWSQWTVPATPELRLGCCIEPVDGVCRLDASDAWSSVSDASSVPGSAVIAVQVQDKGITRAQAFHPDCRLGLRTGEIARLTVQPEQSIAWLAQGLEHATNSQRGGRLYALTAHADAGVDRRFEDWLSRRDIEHAFRRDVMFWSALGRGKVGLASIDRVLAGDEPELRAHAVFVLTQSPVEGATSRLLPLARTDADPEVRRQALFWLAQTGSPAARDALAHAVRHDRDEAVREHALFAYSQLPDGAGVDALITLSRDASIGPDLRRKALFWLAHSEDPRAMAALEQTLGMKN